jgi:hypothetical protein
MDVGRLRLHVANAARDRHRHRDRLCDRHL